MLPGNPIFSYLLHSYLYYVMDTSVITDEEYDSLCADLLENFDNTEHRYKHLVNKDSLRAGSGFHLGSMDYPTPVKVIAEHLREDPLYLDKLDAKWRDKPEPTLDTISFTMPEEKPAPRKPLTLLDF